MIVGRTIPMLYFPRFYGMIKKEFVKYNRSTVVFTASQDGEYAYENSEYGGYFTHSIAEGINEKAASNGNEVLIIPLGEYITERIWNLNRKTNTPLQHPMKYIPDGYHNFVISRLVK